MILSGYTKSSSELILENFIQVLQSAYESYDSTMNESHDFIGICLNELDSSNNDLEFINESLQFQNESQDNPLNESQKLNEATNVTDAKIVKEKKGSGISVKINGKEYRYVSPTKSTEDLFRSFNGMLKHGNAGWKALNWLKANSLCYYGSKKNSEEGRQIVGYND